MIQETAKRIEESEGYRQHKYIDSVGVETIGIGFNLEIGFSVEECRLILKHRIEKLNNELTLRLSYYKDFSDNIKSVLIDMAYNMGVNGLLQFKNTLYQLRIGNYENAAIEMMDSKWAKQVGIRAVNLAKIVHNERFCRI